MIQDPNKLMRTIIGFPSLHNLKQATAISCLFLVLAVDLPQGRAVQLPQPVQKLSDGASLTEEQEKPRFTINVKDVNLRDVLLMMTKNSKYGLMMEPGIDVILPVLDLKSVTLDEALQSLLPGLGLDYQLESNMLKINKPGMQTRLFYVNYIAASRSGKRDMRMSSRSQTGGSGSGGSGGSLVGGSGGQGSTGGSGGSTSENQSTIVTTNNSEVWMDLKLGLESIIFSGGNPEAVARQEDVGPSTSAVRDANNHRLLINPQAGVIMIHAEPAILDEAARYIEAVEGSVQRQVLIEAKVMEVTLSKDHQLGVDWAAILNPAAGFSGLLDTALGVAKPSIGLSTGSVQNQSVNPSAGRFQYSISNGKVGLAIDALSRQGQLRVLSSPRISALNNQKAVIRVVREEVFFTQTSLVSQSVGPTVTTENIENQIVPIGVVLDIIPQISSDGQITLSINPSISELVEIRSFSSKEGNAVSTQPVIDRRDLDTVAKVQSGETVLIAGIMRERKAEDLRGVPWLMNLPFVGNAFRRTEQSSVRTELVIFITPTLISGTRIEELTEEAKQRLKDMEKPFSLGTVEPVKKSIKGELKHKD
jgi:MSHA biogenesis protein MshL